jgi:hypothetical protein
MGHTYFSCIMLTVPSSPFTSTSTYPYFCTNLEQVHRLIFALTFKCSKLCLQFFVCKHFKILCSLYFTTELFLCISAQHTVCVNWVILQTGIHFLIPRLYSKSALYILKKIILDIIKLFYKNLTINFFS